MWKNQIIEIEVFSTHVSHEIGIFKKYLGKKKVIEDWAGGNLFLTCKQIE